MLICLLRCILFPHNAQETFTKTVRKEAEKRGFEGPIPASRGRKQPQEERGGSPYFLAFGDASIQLPYGPSAIYCVAKSSDKGGHRHGASPFFVLINNFYGDSELEKWCYKLEATARSLPKSSTRLSPAQVKERQIQASTKISQLMEEAHQLTTESEEWRFLAPDKTLEKFVALLSENYKN